MRTPALSWTPAVAIALFVFAAAACGKSPTIQHAQCTSGQIEAPDPAAAKEGGCGDAGTIVMKCVDVSSGTATAPAAPSAPTAP